MRKMRPWADKDTKMGRPTEELEETICYDAEANAIRIIDETRLPGETVIRTIRTIEDLRDAIRTLSVRGAPALGIAGGYGMVLAAGSILAKDPSIDPAAYLAALAEAKAYLDAARPTAVNLAWATGRVMACAKEEALADASAADICARIEEEAHAIHEEDIAMCRRIGEYGLSLVKDGDGLLTYCNAGQLAAAKYGTATAPMYVGWEKGMRFRIYCAETRPLLQGARLTSYELSRAGMDVTLLCDNMISAAMRQGLIQAVFVGCDRMAANGDFANKIGTSMVAILCQKYGIPFYVCLPTSTIDPATATGDEIVIEQRDGEEVTTMWYRERMAPEGISVYNPAFDVTDHALITGIVTDRGVLRAPYDEAIAALFA